MGPGCDIACAEHRAARRIPSMPLWRGWYAAGTTIVDETNSRAGGIALCHGWAIRLSLLDDGRRQIVDVILPGEERLLLGTCQTVEALTRARGCIVPSETLAALRADPEIGDRLAAGMHWEARLLAHRLVSLGRRTAFERVAALLIELLERAREVGIAVGATCPLPLTQDHMADLTGLSIVHVNRVLRRLREHDLAHTGRGWLDVRNEQGLRAAAAWERDYAPPPRPTPILLP